MKLNSEVKSALEILMVFINEANEKKFYFPDILGAIERECKSYHSTISTPDLMFIMTHIQDKLDQLLDKTQLERLFCEEFLSKLEKLSSYIGGFIFYQEQVYQIKKVNYLPNEQLSIVFKHNILKVNCQNLKVLMMKNLLSFLKHFS